MLEPSNAVHGLLGSCRERSLVIAGNGRTVWNDLKHSGTYPYGMGGLLPRIGYVPETYQPPDLMAVNDIGMYLPHLEHWVSFHDDTLVLQNELRYRMWPQASQPMLHSNGGGHLVRKDRRAVIEPVVPIHYWRFQFQSLLCSGVLAICVGLSLGYSKIVLAGVPADNDGAFYHPPHERSAHGNTESHGAWQEFLQDVPEAKEKVRSLSGFTRQWFGAPDE